MTCKISILIVDDCQADSDLLVRELRRRIEPPLRATGVKLEIVQASSIEEAIPLAADKNLSIVDLHYPDSDALQSIASLHRFQPPILVLTGSEDPEIRMKAKAAGAEEVFVKGKTFGLPACALNLILINLLETQGIACRNAA